MERVGPIRTVYDRSTFRGKFRRDRNVENCTVWSILSSFRIFAVYTCVHKCVCVCARRPRDNPLSGHVSRAPRCRTAIRRAEYTRTEERGRRPPRLNTKTLKTCVDSNSTLPHLSNRGRERQESFSFHPFRIPPFFLPFSKFFSYYLHEREERNPSDTIERSVIGAASALESGMDSSGPTFG